MSGDEFGDDFGDEAPRAAPRLPKKKKRVEAPPSGKGPAGKAPVGKAKSPAGEAAKKPSQIVAGIVLGLFMAAILGVAIFMAVRQERGKGDTEQAFISQIDQLLQPPKDGASPPGKPGKLAEIDVDQRALYVHHHGLPNDIRAANPDEADYIVQVKETRETVSTYTDGSKGIKVTVDLTVIDKPTWTVLGRKTLVGDDPPLVAVGGGDVVEAPEREEVTAYYRSLMGSE